MKNYFGESHKYEDIIHLPHHVSKNRPSMPTEDRAAQFAPFAALTGYGDAVRETARYTERRLQPDEEQLETLNRRLEYLHEHRTEKQKVTVTYFLQDERKEGGTYEACTGTVKKVDTFRHRLVLEEEREIPFEDLWELLLERPETGQE